jgi:hypothetical protein
MDNPKSKFEPDPSLHPKGAQLVTGARQSNVGGTGNPADLPDASIWRTVRCIEKRTSGDAHGFVNFSALAGGDMRRTIRFPIRANEANPRRATVTDRE